MKEILLVVALLLGGSSVYTSSMVAAESSYSANKEFPKGVREITVYKVVHVSGNAWSTSPKDAYYSRSENCIYVTEGKRVHQPYTVSENRAYSQSNDGRAEYRYTAGGYYFNL